MLHSGLIARKKQNQDICPAHRQGARMKTHELKCWPEFFLAVQAWKKVFEIRHNDRGFEVGDILWLREWDPTTADYSGESVRRAISYITDFPDGLKDGYVCMGLSARADNAEDDDKEHEANVIYEVKEHILLPDQWQVLLPDQWQVEAVGKDGEVYVAVFSGPDAEERAHEYANWKMRDGDGY